MAIELVEQPASRRQRRLVLGLCAALVLAAVLLAPVAGWQGPAWPHVAGIYGVGAAVTCLATFWLLSGTPGPQRAHRVISAAYLYAGLLAILHVLTFPGALVPGQSVVGSSNNVGWLFIAWRAGFPLWILWAVRIQAAPPGAMPQPSMPPAWLAVLLVAGIYAGTQLLNLPAYFPSPGASRFTVVSLLLSHASAIVSAGAVVAIWRSGLASRSLYLWLMLVLVGDAVGLWLSTYSGGRYTLGWYGARIEGILASVILLAILSGHLRSLQSSLADAVEVLRGRTDELQAEIHRRERAERMLLQSQKLEAVGQLAAGLAHDFNNIMQLVAVRIELMRRRAGAVVDQDVEVVRRNLQRATGLTRQLMLFSGRRQLQPRTLFLQQALPGLVSLFSPLVRADLKLEIEVEPDVWPVHVDPAELEVALANLLTNARDATPAGGVIRIGLRNEAATGSVSLSVADDGQGMDALVLERVFEPFFTTKEPGKGTGLGLSQVYAFAKASGGSASIDSTPGQGTLVTLRFPRAEDSPQPVADAVAAPSGVGERGLKVMLVEDHEDVREAAVLLLQEAGCVVCSAGNAAEAMALLQQGHTPDVLLSDIVMPGPIDGVTLAREVRRMLPGVQVVLATGYSAAADKARADGFTVLQKPYETAYLVELLAGAREASSGPAP